MCAQQRAARQLARPGLRLQLRQVASTDAVQAPLAFSTAVRFGSAADGGALMCQGLVPCCDEPRGDPLSCSGIPRDGRSEAHSEHIATHFCILGIFHSSAARQLA